MTAGLPDTPKSRGKAYRNALAAILMVVIAAAPVHAQQVDASTEAPISASVDQVIYKGVIGNLLEAVPLEPEQRVQLQRGNAVVSNALSGRSLAVLLGLTSPLLMIGGLVWGLWAAANIKSAPADSPSASTNAVKRADASQTVLDTGQNAPSLDEFLLHVLPLGGGE